MATFPKISDNEMNYFQFKARQMLLLKKENRDWTNFCKQTAPECSACSTEKDQTNLNTLKNIGIQVTSKNSLKAVGMPPSHSKYRKDLVPETLEDIKTKLENIDLALTKLHDTSNTKEKALKHEGMSLPYPAMKIQDMKLLEDKRKLLIQKSLKDSLQRIEHIHKISEKADKPLTTNRKKNCGYFLPHDLQQKRVAARNAYLASLKNKPKVELSSSFQDKKKKNSNTVNKKDVSSKSIPKFRKKTAPKTKKKESSQTNVPSMLESPEENETQDENIERTVDGILEDLLGEAAADLNRIKINKRNRKSFQVNLNKRDENSPKAIAESSQVNTVPKELMTENDKLKLFWNLPDSLSEEEKDGKQVFEKIAEPFPSKVLKRILNEPKCEVKQSSSKISQAKTFYQIENPPKFVCGVSHLISIDPDKAKQISTSRERFWDYLKSVSRTEKGDFNPWLICNMMAETILDDCIQDVSEELSDLPSTLIKDLYNQEFMQQVEF